MGPLVVFGMYVSRQKALEKYGDKKKKQQKPLCSEGTTEKIFPR